MSSESKCFDAGKKVKWIKRHIIVDTLGLVLAVVVQSASAQDRDGAMEVIKKWQKAEHKQIICRWGLSWKTTGIGQNQL